MSNNKKPARPNSVDSMVAGLGDWFLAPVEPRTPDDVLDEILHRITGEPLTENAANDDFATASRQAFAPMNYEADVVRGDIYVNEVRRAVRAELISLRQEHSAVLEDAFTLTGRQNDFTFSTLTALTDWMPINQRRPAYRMLFKETNSDIRAVLEIARSDTHVAHNEWPWVVNLKRYEDTRGLSGQSEGWRQQPTTSASDHAAPSLAAHQLGVTAVDSGHVLVLVDRQARHANAGLGSMGNHGKDDRDNGQVENATKRSIISAVVCEVLDIEDAGFDLGVKFVELGGDSLSCVEVAVLAAQRGLKVTYSQVLQSNTIAELAESAEFIEPAESKETVNPSSRVSRFVTRSTAQPPNISTLIVAEGDSESIGMPLDSRNFTGAEEEVHRVADLIASLMR
ncbi:acyl carrier protein [Streptomyces longwoodensis]|uniref:acyl carrier protein n=1 Tax=Streptomyces longwoodensis TaxID=68231 RepID=UPI003407CA32